MMIYIFNEFVLKDICECYDSLEINREFCGIGSASIVLKSLDEANKFKIGDYLLIDDDSYIVEYIHKYKDSSKVFNFEITAYHVNKILSQRVCEGITITTTKSYEESVQELIETNFINSSNEDRNINNFDVSISRISTMPNSEYTYGYMLVSECLNRVLSACKLGYRVFVDYEQQKYIFEVLHPNDKHDEVIFTEEYGNVDSCDFYNDITEVKNVCISVTDAAVSTYGSGIGIDRKEMLLESEYNYELKDTIERVSATTELLNNGMYTYKKDYDLGDIVTYYDVELSIETVQQIKTIKEYYSSENAIEIILGEYIPNIFDKLKKGMK